MSSIFYLKDAGLGTTKSRYKFSFNVNVVIFNIPNLTYMNYHKCFSKLSKDPIQLLAKINVMYYYIFFN